MSERELALLAMVVAGCGGARARTVDNDDVFQCHDRSASYLVVGGLAGAELGVALDCEERGPRVRRWVVDHKGTRDEHSRVVSPEAFDDIWNRIDGAGWRYTNDCGKDSSTDPVYTFDVKDHASTVTFSCTGRGELPFPYGRLVDELDLAARGLGGGDDGE